MKSKVNACKKMRQIEISTNEARVETSSIVRGELLAKARCYNCGKVFTQPMVQRYQTFLATEKPQPFEIVTTSEEPYENKVKEFLQGELGLVRRCCRMHFLTPYQLPSGSVNSLVVPGLINRMNADTFVDLKRESIQDPLNQFKEGPVPGKTGKKRARGPKKGFLNPSELGELKPLAPKSKAQIMREKEIAAEQAKEVERRTRVNVDEILEEELDFGDIEGVEEEAVQMPSMKTPASQKSERLNYYPILEDRLPSKRK